ncbi:hypothetical protein BKA81DRAFT_61726 [Phyllosticta paracitricarpa]
MAWLGCVKDAKMRKTRVWISGGARVFVCLFVEWHGILIFGRGTLCLALSVSFPTGFRLDWIELDWRLGRLLGELLYSVFFFFFFFFLNLWN